MGPIRVFSVSVFLLAFLTLAAGTTAGVLLSAPQGPLRLGDGTAVKVRLTQALSSATAQTNDRVNFEVVEEVKVANWVVIPKGSAASGTVTNAEAKRRMGRGGKLDVNIESVRLANGDKAALRGVKDAKGSGHTGAMAGGMVATSLVMFPAAPLFLLMHGKDVTIPAGTELTVYVQGDVAIDPARFSGVAAPVQPATPATLAAGAPTLVLVDPSITNSGETIDVAVPTLTIRGVVTDPTGIPAVTINGTMASMRPKGPQAAEFSSDPMPLHSGDNSFEIVATNAAQLSARFGFVARYSPTVTIATRPASKPSGKGLSKDEIVSLLNGGVPSARVATIVEERGIAFAPTANDLKDIRAAGGSDDLVRSLKVANQGL